MNGRPLTTRKKIQILVALTILCWATHTLLQQWSRGDEIADVPVANAAPGPNAVEVAVQTHIAVPNAPAEVFVPAEYAAAGTLELRGEATIHGGEACLKQVCRWSEADAAMFLQVADLVVLHIDPKTSFKPITLAELRTILRDAGMNLGSVRFAGPTVCNVHRSDAQVDDSNLTLEQWVEARRGVTASGPTVAAPRGRDVPVSLSVTSDPIVAAAAMPATRPAAAARAAAAADRPVHNLRALLLNDLSIRVGIPVEQLVVSFNPANENLLNLSEPQFQFNLEARRVRNLGEVEWEVSVVANGSSRQAPIVALARAWQTQVIADKPLSYHQLIRSGDVLERRALIDRVSDEPLLTLDQCVGQQAARELKPATILTARMVDPVPLAKPGQLITIRANQGGVHLKTVARALEAGSFGQTIHVRNDMTNESYDVVLTGPQEGLVGSPADAAGTASGRQSE